MLTLKLGNWAEKISLSHLENHGLSLIGKNYHGPSGEIDLIMKDDSTLVFIEVKFRSNTRYHHPIESIDRKKCNKIISTSEHFMQSNKFNFAECRFDVVLITGNTVAYEIEWIKNAFHA